VNSKKERISIASFQNANMSKVIGPTPGLVTHERPALFKTLTVEEYFKVFFSNELKGKSCLDVMRIQN
jgi:isopenicillin N synthase-like dioxygenase